MTYDNKVHQDNGTKQGRQNPTGQAGPNFNA